MLSFVNDDMVSLNFGIRLYYDDVDIAMSTLNESIHYDVPFVLF